MTAPCKIIARTALLVGVLLAHAAGADTLTSNVLVTVQISAPTNLAASANSSSQISVSWTDNSSNETGFSVERKTGSSGTYAEIATTAANVASYTNSGLSASTTYFYRVRAFDATSYSPYSNEASATTDATSGGGGSGGGGGGSGGGAGGGDTSGVPFVVVTNVIFKGKAYPNSDVTLLKDAQVVATTKAGPDASFEVAIQNLSAGTYTFGVWAEDAQGNRSITHTFTISITAGVTTTVSGIFIPPFLVLDKTEVKRGDILTLYGASVPGAQVSIVVNSNDEIVLRATSSADGTWVYKFDTDPLEYGDHTARARAAKNNDITSFSRTKLFIVGERNVDAPIVKKCASGGDLNSDCKTNLIDFSVLAYWYRRPDPPAKIDLNGDGKINLVDFSIMAYYWTG